MEVRILDENVSQEQITQLNNMLEIARSMIIKFVSDKLGDKIPIDRITNIMDASVFYLDNERLGSDVAARYEGVTKALRVGKTVYNAKTDHLKISALSTIIHELQHKFSHEISHGFSQGKEDIILEEGFADVFADECINYCLQNNPQELKTIGINNPPSIYISRDDYEGENQFVRILLEVVKQKSGRHYEAEYEYIFGEKDNFLDIIRDTIGVECVKIIEEQMENGNKNKQLGNNYNYSYNERLINLIQDIPLEYIERNDDSDLGKINTNDFDVFLYRQNDAIRRIAGRQQLEKRMLENGIDIYNMTPKDIEVFKKVYSELPFGINSPIIKGYSKNCRTANDIELLLELEEMQANKYGIRLEAIEALLNSTNIDTHNLLRVIGNNIFADEKFLKDEDMKKLLYKIDEIEISTCSDAEIDAILRIALKNNTPDDKLLKKIEEIEQIKKDEIEKSIDKQLEIKLAKMKTGKQPKGQEISQIFQMIFESGDRIQDLDLNRFVLQTINEYIENEAKNDPKGFDALVDKMKTIEELLEQGQQSNAAQGLCSLTKDKIFDVLLEDIKEIEPFINSYLQIDEREKIQNREWWTEDFENMIAIPNNSYFYLMDTLSTLNRRTKLIDLFGGKIIEQCLTGRINDLVKIENNDSEKKSKYAQLNMQDRKKCLQVLTGMVQGDNEELQNIGAIISLYKEIMNFDVDEDKKISDEVKQAFHDKIVQIISFRKDPIEDLQTMYRIKIPKSLKFMYDAALSNLERRINEQQNFSDEDIQNLVYTAPKDKNIQRLMSTALATGYEGVTTDEFIKRFILEIQSSKYFKPNSILPEEKKRLQAWIETRTMGYLKAIGKIDDKNQKNFLLQLQEKRLDGEIIKTPQYVSFNTLDGQSKYAMLSNIKDSFKVFLEDESPMIENEEDLVKQQNKRKKGLLSIFKRKKDKELITDTVVLDGKKELVQVLNRYESGRLEVAILNRDRKRIKVNSRNNIEPQDIGNNGGMVINSSIVPKIGLEFQKEPTKGRITLENQTERETENQEQELEQ